MYEKICSEEIVSGSNSSTVSRRMFLTISAAGLGAVTAGCSLSKKASGSSQSHSASSAPGSPQSRSASSSSRTFSRSAPFDSIREYIEALEERGLLMRFEKLDQDAYEMTALMYRFIDHYGWEEAPTILAEQVKINGKWIEGPVIANHQGHLDTEAITFGVEPIPKDPRATYRKAMSHLESKLVEGEFPLIDPIEVQPDQAVCKEVVLKGDEIDLTKFAFIKSNPADVSRYITTASVFTHDPEMGPNYGTYRCQLRGPRLVGVNPEPKQTGWKHLMAAKERGEKSAKVALVLGQDPYVWIVSSSRVVNRMFAEGPVDELAVAGGLRGKAMEVVRCETNDMLIPAHAELVIEGEIPLDQPGLPEAPFGEMAGYMGLKKKENFFMNVTAVTHRKKPWLVNQFTGATRGYSTGPTAVLFNTGFKRLVPELIELHSPVHAPGLTYMSIKKTEPGQGLEAGKILAGMIPIYKVVIVVDEDIDILDQDQVDNALIARWQPNASYIFEEVAGLTLDPSQAKRGKTSKIVIDATKQWPEEGGPEVFPERNRTLLEKGAPDAFAQVDAKFSDIIKYGFRYQDK